MRRKKLTVKQRKFCNYYAKNGNATQAAIKAGYSKKTAGVVGFENLKKPYIKKRINERLKKIDEDSILSSKQAYKFLTKVVLGKITDDVILATPEGEIRDKKHSDTSERIKAAKELLNRPLLQSQIAKNNQSTAKLKAETEIKQILAKQSSTKNNQTISKVDELLDKIFK